MHRNRRVTAALTALLPLTALLAALSSTSAGADATQGNGCLGVTGTFSGFSVPITGAATPSPVTAPTSITLSGVSVTVAVDATLIGAGITTGLVTAAPDLAHIGVSQVNTPPDGGTVDNPLGGISKAVAPPSQVKLKVQATNADDGTAAHNTVQTVVNSAEASTTFYVTASAADGSNPTVYSSVTNPSGGLDPGRTGAILSGSLLINIPLANSTWVPTGAGNVSFAEQNIAPANLLTPSAADKTASPLQINAKINPGAAPGYLGGVSVPFKCWPGTVSGSVAPVSLVPGASNAFANATVEQGSSTTAGGSTTSQATTSTTAGSTTTTTQGTTTTTVATTTTVLATTTTAPATVSGTGVYAAGCKNSVTPDASTLTFHLTGTAPGSVIAGSPVSLSNQIWTMDVPGSVLTAGLNLGLLTPGQTVEGKVTAGVFASNTAEGKQTSAPIAVTIGPITVDPETDLARDTSASFAVQTMTWTAVGGTVGYSLDQTEATVTIGPLKVKFTCQPASGATPFLMTQVQGTTDILPAVQGSTTTAQPTQVLGVTLARTGINVRLLVVFGLLMIDIGYLGLTAAQLSGRRKPRATR